jgi:hypothetical protein
MPCRNPRLDLSGATLFFSPLTPCENETFESGTPET